MLYCEWLNKLIAVDRSSGLVRVSILTGTQAGGKKYEQQVLSDRQTPPRPSGKCMKCVTVLDACSGVTSPHLLVTHTPQSGFSTHRLLVYNSNGSFEDSGLEFGVEESDLPLPSERAFTSSCTQSL